MTNLTLEMPDDLARTLEGIAAAEHKTLQQFAVDRLRLFAERYPVGSPAAILQALLGPPHPSSADVDELDAAIAAGRLPVSSRDYFPE